jgi:hypothetical protein
MERRLPVLTWSGGGRDVQVKPSRSQQAKRGLSGIPGEMLAEGGKAQKRAGGYPKRSTHGQRHCLSGAEGAAGVGETASAVPLDPDQYRACEWEIARGKARGLSVATLKSSSSPGMNRRAGKGWGGGEDKRCFE